jgi:NAD(P)-dependent dehydrogenase (short-subunit alcohol dehydrogenase family)
MMEWRNQVAVVTGGARGLGRATAQLLAQRGAAVCVNYAVHADGAEALVAEIATAGERAIAVAADVADSAAVEAMVARIEAELGPVTILVNNAGVAWQGRHSRRCPVLFRCRACGHLFLYRIPRGYRQHRTHKGSLGRHHVRRYGCSVGI